MKSYTDLEQSKKLAELLPLESADMYYALSEDENMNMVNFGKPRGYFDKTQVTWSLSALLNVLPDGTNVIKDKSDTENEKYMCTVEVINDIISTFGNNPVDACVEMIVKLKGNNLL